MRKNSMVWIRAIGLILMLVLLVSSVSCGQKVNENGSLDLMNMDLTKYITLGDYRATAYDITVKAVTEADEEIQRLLLETAQKQGIAVKILAYDVPYPLLDGGMLTLSAPLYEKRSSQPAFSMLLSFGKQSVCYHASGFDEFAENAGVSHTCGAEYLLLGGHGPVPHSSIGLSCDKESVLVISDSALLPLLTLPPAQRRVIAPAKYFFVME